MRLNLLDESAGSEIRRAFWMLAVMTMAFGMAMAIQQNIVTNYFDQVLGLKGPQFGYITAIREVPGFLLIGLTALFFRMSVPRLTAMSLVLLAAGYALFGVSNSFWTVAPWVILSSMGYHTVLQTQYALGMSLTTQNRSGKVLGQMSGFNAFGSLGAMILVLVTFHFHLLTFRPAFAVAGLLALVAAAAVFRFPTLRDGVKAVHVPRPERIVVRRPYRLYYYLSLLDGARQQIFFSFGLWVLVQQYGLTVPAISGLLLLVSISGMVTGPLAGQLIDRRGEKHVLGIVNVGYILALAGYAFVHSAVVAAACYALYSLIMPLSSVGAATYLRKVALADEIPPSLAMGVTLQHAAAIVVPITTGFILNFVSYRVPFLIACVFACGTIVVTRRLDPVAQRSPGRVHEDELGAHGASA